MKRSSGILLPVSALPSPYGIGTLGQAAYDYIDFLAAAGQRWWQVLPLGPTSYGDSPYQSFSTYAGNPYFIDLDLLAADGLLTAADLAILPPDANAARVDYQQLYTTRLPLLAKATEKAWERDAEQVEAFTKIHRNWLPDYALFMACKRHFDMAAWTEWDDEDLRLHKPEAVNRYMTLLSAEVRLFTHIQYLFYTQWEKLRAYAAGAGVGIIGDMPIYVALDSADVWADPGSFQLDRNNLPVEVAGVPPDYFSADGQLWGNPLYNWGAMAKDGYGWWIRRVEGAARLYDVIRIDHFRGFESYWAVPYGAETAKTGRWVKGPGMALVGVLTGWFPQLSFIAEDLGILTPAVHQLLEQSGLPGMKVLEFAFSVDEPSAYLPHRYRPNCVCYAGTHDNAPLLAWREDAAPEELALATAYLGLNEAEGFHWGILRGGMGSVAELFVAQMQDYLGLGAESRTNTPGTLGGNWQWRLLPGQATGELADKIRRMTTLYGRLTASVDGADSPSEIMEKRG